MLNDVYNSKILEYAGNIAHIGRLKDPDATAKAHSKLCGSTVIVDLKMKDGVVTDFAHEVKACALGQASSSIMAKNVIGSTAAELKKLKSDMYAMLKDNAEPPSGKFEEFRFLEPVRDYKARHASTLLAFDAVVDCIEQIESGQQTKAKSMPSAQSKAERKEKVQKAAASALSAAGIGYRVR